MPDLLPAPEKAQLLPRLMTQDNRAVGNLLREP